MAPPHRHSRSLMDRINDIDIEDLQYMERDLCFYELVSLGFLLYGRERTTSEFILQKLIVLSQNPPKGNGSVQAGTDILRKYASINPNSWRVNIVEALSIIRSKMVLRKLGFFWEELHDHYLPHIPELSVHIHPLLKALYKICERLSIVQAGRMVTKINELHLRQESQQLRFYDYSFLEVFLLYWSTRRIISFGNQGLQGSDVQELISYLKLNDLDSMKSILIVTINHNSAHETLSNTPAPASSRSAATHNVIPARHDSETNKDSGAVMESLEMLSADQVEIGNSSNTQDQEEFDFTERYVVRRKHAGFVLIINQSEFHQDNNPLLKHQLPPIPFKKQRAGTDVDRDKLKKLFSSFGYTPLVYNNLTHIDILHVISETVERTLVRDSLIVCILSHGMEGVVYGCNSIPISINTIKSLMTAETLRGKPKMLIIQACQKNKAPVDTSVSNAEHNFQPDDYADMLIAMSSIPGTEALRHTLNGSWFIESLCKLTEKWCNRKHMMDILTKVIDEVAQKHSNANEFMLPFANTTLRKEFYLPPRT